jgi:hypothetical protein
MDWSKMVLDPNKRERMLDPNTRILNALSMEGPQLSATYQSPVEQSVAEESIAFDNFEGHDDSALPNDYWLINAPDASSDQEIDNGMSDDNDSVKSETEFNPDDPVMCGVCSDTTWSRRNHLILCSNEHCRNGIHMKCFTPPLAALPKENMYCCQQCKDFNENKPVIESKSEQELVAGMIDDNIDDRWDIELNSEEVHACGLRVAAASIRSLARRNPMISASMEKWVHEGRGCNKEGYTAFIEGIERLLDAHFPLTISQKALLSNSSPPENIKRVLRNCGDAYLMKEELVHTFQNGTEAYFVFHFRSPYAAALDLYESDYVKMKGPVYSWDQRGACTSSNRLPGRRYLKELVKTFAATMGFDPNNQANLTLPLIMYSDDTRTASGNVQFNPMWLHIATMDPDTRNMCDIDGHALVGLLPDHLSIEYRFKDRTRGPSRHVAPSSITKNQRKTALGQLKNMAMKAFLREWKKHEQTGLRCQVDGKTVFLRILLFNVSNDMKERREHLCLKRNKYHCSRCYDFPGRNNTVAIGNRSTDQDEDLRRDFLSDGRDNDKAKDLKDFNEAHGEHGLRLMDECPFTSAKTSEIFTLTGPYEIFRFDALHMKHGVIVYYMKFLEDRLGGGFVAETERFGNIYLMTGKFSMHIMEKDIESFHFVPLALAFGDFNVTEEDREELFLGSCSLLYILALLTDPCPGFILDELKAAILMFQAHIGELLRSVDTNRTETTKMHELFCHVLDQIEEGGLPNAFGCKKHETFHDLIKDWYEESSRRREGVSFREIILTDFHRMSILHAKAGDTHRVKHIERDEPYSPQAMFHISHLQLSKTVAAATTWRSQLQDNISRIVNCLFPQSTILFRPEQLEEGTEFMNIDNGDRFGNSLRCWIQCSRRNVRMSHFSTIIVPGSSAGMFFNGGTFNVLAYQQLRQSLSSYSVHGRLHPKHQVGCGDANCRFHNDIFQLFCSSVRENDTCHGIPLLFVGEVAIVFPLTRRPMAESESFKSQKAIIEYDCSEFSKLVAVPFAKIRGACMLKPPNVSLFGGNGTQCFVFST